MITWWTAEQISPETTQFSSSGDDPDFYLTDNHPDYFVLVCNGKPAMIRVAKRGWNRHWQDSIPGLYQQVVLQAATRSDPTSCVASVTPSYTGLTFRYVNGLTVNHVHVPSSLLGKMLVVMMTNGLQLPPKRSDLMTHCADRSSDLQQLLQPR